MAGTVLLQDYDSQKTGQVALAWPGLALPGLAWPGLGLGWASQRLGCTMTLAFLPNMNAKIKGRNNSTIAHTDIAVIGEISFNVVYSSIVSNRSTLIIPIMKSFPSSGMPRGSRQLLDPVMSSIFQCIGEQLLVVNLRAHV